MCRPPTVATRIAPRFPYPPLFLAAAILLWALPAAAVAMRDGWRRHRRTMPAILAVTGLGLLALGLSAHEGWIAAANPEMADRLSTSAGALTLAAAHLVNWRWHHRSGGHKLPA